MHLIEHAAAPCLVCGRGNATINEEELQFIDLERDVNWNDPAIICEDCGTKVGALFGMLSGEERNELRRQISELKGERHELRAEIDGMKRRVSKLGIAFTDEEAA